MYEIYPFRDKSSIELPENKFRQKLEELGAQKIKLNHALDRAGKLLANYSYLEKIFAKKRVKKTRDIKDEVLSQISNINTEMEEIRGTIRQLRAKHPRIIAPDDLIDLFNVNPTGYDDLRRDFRFFGTAAKFTCRISLNVDYLDFVTNGDLLIQKLANHLSNYKSAVQKRVMKAMSNPLLYFNYSHYQYEATEKNLSDFYQNMNAFLKQEIVLLDDRVDPNQTGIILKNNLLDCLKEFFTKNNYEHIIELTESPLYGFYYNIMIMKILNKVTETKELFNQNFEFSQIEFEEVGSCTFGSSCFYNLRNNSIYLNTAFYQAENDSKESLLQNEHLQLAYAHYTTGQIAGFIKEHILNHELAHFIFSNHIAKENTLDNHVYSEVFARLVGLINCKIPLYDISTYDSMSIENPVYQKTYTILYGYFKKSINDFKDFESLVQHRTYVTRYFPHILKQFLNDTKNPVNRAKTYYDYLTSWVNKALRDEA